MAQPESAGAGNDDLLRRRAERLARPVALEEDTDEAQLLVAEFSVGDARYALPLANLRMALPLRDVTPVPLAPAHVIGVLRFEGQVITALSFASLLSIRGWRRDPAVLLVVACARKLVALDSETIPKLGTLPRAAIEIGRSRSADALVEIVTSGGQVTNLIDLDRLIQSRGLG